MEAAWAPSPTSSTNFPEKRLNRSSAWPCAAVLRWFLLIASVEHAIVSGFPGHLNFSKDRQFAAEDQALPITGSFLLIRRT